MHRAAYGRDLRPRVRRLPEATFLVLVQRVAREERARLKRRHHYGRACRSKADIAGLIDSLIVPVNDRARAAITFGSMFEEAHFAPVLN